MEHLSSPLSVSQRSEESIPKLWPNPSLRPFHGGFSFNLYIWYKWWRLESSRSMFKEQHATVFFCCFFNMWISLYSKCGPIILWQQLNTVFSGGTFPKDKCWSVEVKRSDSVVEDSEWMFSSCRVDWNAQGLSKACWADSDNKFTAVSSVPECRSYNML